MGQNFFLLIYECIHSVMSSTRIKINIIVLARTTGTEFKSYDWAANKFEDPVFLPVLRVPSWRIFTLSQKAGRIKLHGEPINRVPGCMVKNRNRTR